MTRLVCALLPTFFLCSLPVVSIGATTKTAEISQWGITWYFDKQYEYGKFANGDYWVLGPVTITRITPDYDGENNGWEVNPVVSGNHGFQSGCYGNGFDKSLVPNLPYKSPESGIVSIVKTIPTGTNRPCIKTAAVLTVATSIPPGQGADVFRPPYVGAEKAYYFVSDLRTDLLPSLDPVGVSVDLSYIENRFRKLRLDHKKGAIGRALRPQDAMEDYQPKNSEDIINAALRLMMKDDISAKLPALIQYIQAGIDKVHSILLGQTWPPGGGHQPAHILPSAITATMLNMNSVKTVLKNATFFHASNYLYSTNKYGNQVWGENSTEQQYWDYLVLREGSRSNKDPYEYIDGGVPGEAYQNITSQSHKGEALAARLMPSLQEAWPDADLFYATNYSVRWVYQGTITQPDPCAPYDGNPKNYGITFGPDPNNPGQCILDSDLAYFNTPRDFKCQDDKECGRFTSKDNTNRDGGQYRSNFVAAIWETYWKLPPPLNLRIE